MTKRMLRAIKIDVDKQTVYEVLIPDTLEALYACLDCELVEIGSVLANGDEIYVDEEGLLKEPRKDYFMVLGMPQPLAGHGIVVGPDESELLSGDHARSSVEDIQKMVRFFRGNEILEPEPTAEFFAAEPGESMADLQARASKEMAKKNPWRNPPNAS
jgi:hypothetical protein